MKALLLSLCVAGIVTLQASESSTTPLVAAVKERRKSLCERLMQKFTPSEEVQRVAVSTLCMHATLSGIDIFSSELTDLSVGTFFTTLCFLQCNKGRSMKQLLKSAVGAASGTWISALVSLYSDEPVQRARALAALTAITGAMLGANL